MIKGLPVFALLLIATAGSASAEPQGGFPAQRDRGSGVTSAVSKTTPSEPGKKDEIQRRLDAMAKRDRAITSSICRGC